MQNSETIAIISIVTAATSACVVAFFTFRFNLKIRKLDLLYSSRIAAFKEVSSNLVSFKNFCNGKLAFSAGNEFSPFYEEGFGALYHRTRIAKSFESGSIFLSTDSRVILNDLISQMSGLCNGEASLASEPSDLDLDPEYQRMATLSESAIEVLYQELGVGNL